MMKHIKMITFDLDDTLWNNRPTIIKAEIDNGSKDYDLEYVRNHIEKLTS